MKKILLVAFALVSILKLNAQQCATDEYDAFMKRTNPQYAAERQKMEQQIYFIIKNKQNNPNARIAQNDCQPGGVFTIPVVVHIIHKGEVIGVGTNITDAQVIDAIRGMNDRWRKIIGDGVDLEVQFALAVRDTNNNATNGITRYDGRVFPRYTANGIYYNNNSTGANQDTIINNTVWDRNRYINIWIADIRGAGGWASLYGNYTFFASYNISSNTLAHEMGHTFSLYHTFNGDGSLLSSSTQCPANNDCLLDGDLVCDTPPHRVENCNTTSCAPSGDLLNSFRNYMSYCGATTRFTQGQKERVRAALYNDFERLIYSPTLIPINTTLEVGIDNILNNLNEPICLSEFIPKIKIRNIGTSTITNLKITTYLDGILLNTNNINTTLVSNNSTIFTLNTINFTSSGIHNLKFIIEEMNGSTNDYSSINNQICKDVLVRNNPVNSLCLNLEDNNINFILFNQDTTNILRFISIPGCINVGNKVLKYTKPASAFYNSNTFYLPAVNLDSVYSAYLVFDHAYRESFVNSYAGIRFYKINGCDSASVYFDGNIDASVSGYDSINEWKPIDCSDWKKDSVYLGNKAISNFIIKCEVFNYQSNQPLYLDNFCIHKRYQIATITSPSNNGSVSYSGNVSGYLNVYDEGSTATITATPYYCKSFKNWTENGVVVSTSPSYTFTVNKNRNLVANFERAKYNIILSANNVSNGTVVGNGTYNCDTIITITAMPLSCYNFANWTENGTIVSSNVNYTFRVTSNRNLVANFIKKQYLISLSSNDINKGTVTGEGSYGCDTTVAVKANIKTGGSWQNWTENGTIVSTDSIYSFNVSTNRILVANFTATKYKISVSTNIPYAINQGWVDTTTNYYNYGVTVQMFAQECCCYKFTNWTENGIVVSTAFNYTFIATQSRNLVANYVLKQRSVFARVNDTTKGYVLGSGVYDCGSNIILQAHVKQGAKWLYWTYYGSQFTGGNDSILTITVTNSNDSNYVANFTAATYSITTSSNIANAGIVTGSSTISYGTTVSVTATPASCYTFKNWTENGIIVSTNANYSFTIIANRNLVANFEKKRYTIAVSSNNIINGTVIGNGTYGCDTITTVTATPATCYNFIKWTENGSTVSTNASYSFTVTANRNLLAIFEPKRYNISLAANPTYGGTVSGAGNFACDSSLTVKAKIKTGYQFTNWTEGSTIVSTDSNYTFLMAGTRSLKANFSLVTGIKQTTINEISKIYPNPANDILQIEIRSKQNTSITLNIIDMKGSLLETKTINNTKGTFNTSFDVSKLAKGNYLLNLYDEDGMASYKFIVQ